MSAAACCRCSGVHPYSGRLLSPQDDDRQRSLTAVLSYGLWQRAFGGDRGVLGRDIRLNGNACTVVGVMPRGLRLSSRRAGPARALGSPCRSIPASPGGRGSHFLSVLAPLKPA